MAELYEALCDMFIRPTRQHYSPYDLGCPLIGSTGRRRDLTITNTRGFRLQCSYYEPLGHSATQCVIYLHSLNGCRLECIRLPEHFLKEGIGFASLDFTACGNSEGQYVSLGCHETQDTLEFVEFLHHNYKITSFALWGRSMGAVTAIKFADMYESDFVASKTIKWSLTAIVLDSPFSNLHKLALEIADKKINIPQFLIKAALVFVKRSIQQKADFKFQQLDLSDCIRRLSTPVMILASKEDELISYRHSEEIFNGYLGKDKQLQYVEGNHNEYRSQQLVQKLAAFIIRRFQLARKKQRDQSTDDGKRRLTSIKSSVGNLTILTSNKSFTTLNASSLTPTSKPSARIGFSNDKNYCFKTDKKRFHPHQVYGTEEKSQLYIGEFSQKLLIEPEAPDSEHSSEHIQIDERAHFNIIHEKLGNMKKKGFLMASPIQKKCQQKPLTEVKRKHTISLSKSPLTNNSIVNEPPNLQINIPNAGYPPSGESQRTSDLKNSIIAGMEKSHNLKRFNKKLDIGSYSNRKELNNSKQQLLVSPLTPTK